MLCRVVLFLAGWLWAGWALVRGVLCVLWTTEVVVCWVLLLCHPWVLLVCQASEVVLCCVPIAPCKQEVDYPLLPANKSWMNKVNYLYVWCSCLICFPLPSSSSFDVGILLLSSLRIKRSFSCIVCCFVTQTALHFDAFPGHFCSLWCFTRLPCSLSFGPSRPLAYCNFLWPKMNSPPKWNLTATKLRLSIPNNNKIHM